ncbi:hypothetical protein PtB15_9B197 [Puccinia triticina]|nr:hypothetical protein PtB15_9B197 [Puccinia triticina]
MEYSYDTIYYYVYALPPTFSSPAAEDHRQRLPATFLGRVPTRAAPASPVYQRREAGWAPSGTSPVYRPAEQGSPMTTSNRMVINGDWPLPAAPHPSNITSPSSSPQGPGVDSSACTSGTGGLAYPPGLSPQDDGASAPAVPPSDPVRTDREWTDLPVWTTADRPTTPETFPQDIEVDPSEGVLESKSDADAAESTDADSPMRSPSPLELAPVPIADYPSPSNADIQVLLCLTKYRGVAIPNVHSDKVTYLYENFITSFVFYCRGNRLVDELLMYTSVALFKHYVEVFQIVAPQPF